MRRSVIALIALIATVLSHEPVAAQAHGPDRINLNDVVPAETRPKQVAVAADGRRAYFTDSIGQIWLFDRTTRKSDLVATGKQWDLTLSPITRVAFEDLQQAREYFDGLGADLAIASAPDPGSREADIAHELDAYHVTVPRLRLTASGLALTEARNQMPTTLLFRDGALVDRRLGAQTAVELQAWVSAALAIPASKGH